ncbi:flagellar hook-basal body complex protein [Vibrio coralliirubri]|uniref:flagellar hook protein FlgE n=1 Tax=Vibrio coralliirubri TaxID=1516159 RepID=UPI00228482CD|nr:flagellar hook-basal body complex protein [Vibrio coralliirubri]MCY9860971.1 flagellar hook-basal body complex protein [Vibrio coralliirubri]
MSDLTKIASAGLRAANSQLANTANNLSNSETFGFKSQSNQFAALWAGTGGDAIGMGVTQQATITNFSNGALIPSGNPLHHAIIGDDFFMVKDSSGNTKYSRVGLFDFNPDGLLVDHYGNAVQGVDGSGLTQDIQLDKSPLPPSVTTTGEIAANLGTDDGTGSLSATISVFDSLGAEHSLQFTFDNKTVDAATGEATWDLEAKINGETINLGAIAIDANGYVDPDAAPLVGGKLDLDLTGLTNPIIGVPSVEIDMSKITGFDGNTTIRTQSANGAPVAEFDKYQVEENGKVMVYYKNGASKSVGQIAMASVENVNGMMLDGNYYSKTVDAGDMTVGVSGQAGFGTMNSGAIEGSNVNATDELVNMITSQRFFQQNAKVIAAAKELDSALMQSV